METIEKIKKLAEQYKRNIIFHFDDDGSFAEELPALAETGIQLIEVKQNFFELKHQLEFELKDQLVFLYHPYPKPVGSALKKYPLLDLLSANVELRLDDASAFLAEYRLKEYQLPLVKRHIKQLKVKANQKKLASILEASRFTEENLKWGLISITLDLNTVVDRNLCFAKWLSLATDSKTFEKANNSLKALGLDSVLLVWINDLLDTQGKNLDYDFAVTCANIVKYNILTVYIGKPHENDNYTKYKITHKPNLNRMQAFFNEWLNHSSLGKHIDTVFEQLGGSIRSSKILDLYGSAQAYGYYPAGILNRILYGLYEQLDENPLKAREESQRWLRSVELSEVQQAHISLIFHTANIHTLLSAFTSFRFNNPEEFIRQYTTELYKVDLHFRKAVPIFSVISEAYDEYAEAATKLFQKLNERYDAFLKDFNVEWQQMLKERKFNFKEIAVKKQYEFYKNNLESFEYKIVVIISDAFRYELGQELYHELVADSKNSVSIEPYLASVPSYTNLGMANLLPHKSMDIEKATTDLLFKIKGIPTTHNMRGEILHEFEKRSNAINYSEVMQLNQDTGRKYFSDNRIVYIYHDWIDAIGDKKKTEHQTFEAATKAQEDISKLLKKLFAWNIYHVLITADHGFLYNHTHIAETAREIPPKTVGYAQLGTRYAIADDFEGKVEGYVADMRNTTHLDTDLKIALPRAINRYRKQGNIGLQFAHGGAAIQELLVPVIKVYRQKKETSRTVSFKRIDDNKKISSGSIKVTLLQDQPVSNDYKALELIIGLYADNGELYAKETELTLNSTSTSPKDRIFEVILSLNPKGSKANFCYLRAFDKSDKNRLNPIIVNDLIQITSLMEKDF
jgi:uncharacterized protein (TIGR02687 family)